MQCDSPLLSIVIPTCDRPYLLQKVVQAYLSAEDARVEIVISDNFSSPETHEVIKPWIASKKVRYVRTQRRLSMPDHWEFAFSHAQGRYVMMSGDDDVLILPHYLPRVLELLEEGTPELFSWRTALYWHPDWFKEWEAGSFQIPRKSTGYLFRGDPRVMMQRYAAIEIDCFPHALALIFSRTLGERVQEKCGKLFWPFAPDFTAPCLMLTEVREGKWHYFDAHLGFGGRSSVSNAASLEKNVEKKHAKRMQTFEEEFQGEDLFPYHDLKVSALNNVFFAPFFIAKALCPEFFAQQTLPFDYVKLASKVLYEIYEVKINQPLIRPEDVQRLEKWVERHAPGEWKKVCAEIKPSHRKKREPTLISEEERKSKVEKAGRVHLDALDQLNETYAVIRCPHLGLEDATALAAVAHHFLERYAICDWERMAPLIACGLVKPLKPGFDQALPYVGDCPPLFSPPKQRKRKNLGQRLSSLIQTKRQTFLSSKGNSGTSQR